MAERALRGSRLGTTSYEVERDNDLAPRREVTFDCAAGHETRVIMASDAELPATWECRTCGATALLRDGEAPAAKAGKPIRTHWDMLLERRSIDDLEDVLTERLAELFDEVAKRHHVVEHAQRKGVAGPREHPAVGGDDGTDPAGCRDNSRPAMFHGTKPRDGQLLRGLTPAARVAG